MLTCRYAVLTLFLLMTIPSLALGQPSVPSKTKRQDFLIVSYKHDGSNHAAVIASTQVRKLGKREFMAGKMIYAGEQSALVGTTIWIPIDAISRMTEFPSAADAIRAAKVMSGEVEDKVAVDKTPAIIPIAPGVLDEAIKRLQVAPIEWRTDYDAARKEAASKNLPLVLFFVKENATPVARFEEVLNKDPLISAFLSSKTIPVRLTSGALAQTLQVNAFPTLILANSHGKILNTLIGYQDPDALYAALTRVFAQAKQP